MIKFILPAIIVLLIVLFWEKIAEIILKKFNIRLNYIVVEFCINNYRYNNFITQFLNSMNNFDLLKYEVNETDGVFTFKNDNTTLGFVRFNKIGEVEYIFVNPIFRNQGLAKNFLS